MVEINPIGQLALHYSNQPIVQALARFLPGGSSLDVLLKTRAQEIGAERARVFFEELAQAQAEITAEIIESEDFIHRFVITAKAAVNTRRQEKIRLFARLFSSSMGDEPGVNTDKYEEYLAILDELSYREFVILSTLERYESRFPKQESGNGLTRCSRFWADFLAELEQITGLQKDEINAMLSRLNRTGCYSTFTGTYLNYSGDRGQLTDLYFKLKRLL